MRRRPIVGLTLLVLFSASLQIGSASAGVGAPISNEEQRVNGHAVQGGTDQFLSDISGDWITWIETRNHRPGNPPFEIWAKNLSTRDELLVTELSTDRSVYPRVSGDWVVWADNPHGNADIFARELPAGGVVRVTTNDAHQINPDIDGTTVVWEDRRNETQPPNVDVFKKDLQSGTEEIVTFAPGDQLSPVVSAGTIAWRDLRRGPSKWDVYARVGANPEIEVWHQPDDAGPFPGFPGFELALDSGRAVWTHMPPCSGDECATQLLTCVVTAGCVTETVHPNAGGFVQSGPDISGTRVVWSQDERLLMKDLSGGDATQISTGLSGMNAEIEGSKVSWENRGSEYPSQGIDIFWTDVATGMAPTRANSLGFGGFEAHRSPVADGNNVVFHRRDRVWGAKLSPRDEFEISTALATGTGPPRIVGSRAVWYEGQGCAATCTQGDVFHKDPFDTGLQTQLSNPDATGGPPDVEGTTVAWRCGETTLCTHSGGSVTTIDVSGSMLGPTSIIGDRVRISGDVLVWSEFRPPPETDGRLHARHLSTGADEILGPGPGQEEEVDDPFFNCCSFFFFDISGNQVVWSDGGQIWRNTAAGCGGDSSCDHSASAAQFEEPPTDEIMFNEVSIDGTRVAWGACFFGEEGGGTCDIYTRLLDEPDSHLVTDGSISPASQPYVDGDRIFWIYESGILDSDIYMESVSGTPLPAPDLAPPGPVKKLKSSGSGSVLLTWDNPTDTDLKGVRILRKSGPSAPTSATDPTAIIVFDGSAANFTDADVVSGVSYSYAAFAYDEFPNFSSRAKTHARP